MEVKHDALQQAFRNAFDNADLEVTDTSSKEDIAEWDSINHLNLVVELEDVFKVKFTVEEIERMNSVSGILAILNTKG